MSQDFRKRSTRTEHVCRLAAEVRVIAFLPHYRSETVASAFMGRVVARLTEDDAVVHGVGSSELDVPEMMGLRALAESVFRSPCVTKSSDVRPAAGAPEFLTGEG